MVDEMLQKIKEKLLEELIGKMSDGMGDRMKPKGLGVEVQAPDSEKLAEGLDKAKDLVAGSDDDKPSDEDRMAALSGKGNVGPDTDSDDDKDDDDEEMMKMLESMHKS